MIRSIASSAFFALVMVCGLSAQGQAQVVVPLKQVFPAAHEKTAASGLVQVSYQLRDQILVIDFLVQQRPDSVKPIFGPSDFPFQFDVVEVFLNVQNSTDLNYPYLEFEITPLGQRYDVRIESPRRFIGGVQTNTVATAATQSRSWTAHFEIPLLELGWSGDPKQIRANFFAVLGPSAKRRYFSAFSPVEKRPNFHQPRFFRSLF